MDNLTLIILWEIH